MFMMVVIGIIIVFGTIVKDVPILMLLLLVIVTAATTVSIISIMNCITVCINILLITNIRIHSIDVHINTNNMINKDFSIDFRIVCIIDFIFEFFFFLDNDDEEEEEVEEENEGGGNSNLDIGGGDSGDSGGDGDNGSNSIET